MNTKTILAALLIFASISLKFSTLAKVVNNLNFPIKVELIYDKGTQVTPTIDSHSSLKGYGQKNGWCLKKIRVWIDDDGLGYDTEDQDIFRSNGAGWCGAGVFEERKITISSKEIPVPGELSIIDYSVGVSGGW